MEWEMLCFGLGQEVEGGVVTEGNLLRRVRMSGGGVETEEMGGGGSGVENEGF
jgi:hypothetical protein